MLTELIFGLMLTELIKRRERLTSTIVFIIVEVSLSLSLLISFLRRNEFFICLFCLGKLGAFPLWFWVFRLFQGLRFSSLFWVISVYKVIPLRMAFLLLNTNVLSWLVSLNRLVILYLFFYTKNFRGSLTVLVIFSMGWILARRISRSLSIFIFFRLYVVILRGLLFSEKNEPRGALLLFYSGLPPLGSFFGKLFVFFRTAGSIGIQFLPLLLGLILVTSWIFLSLVRKKGLQTLGLLFLIMGFFLYLWSFAEALVF